MVSNKTVAKSIRRRTRTAKRRQTVRLGLERLEDRCLLTAISWDGGPDGTGTDWNFAANWAGDVLPTNSSDVQIGAAFAGITITHAAGNTTIRSLASEAKLEITNGSVSIVFGSGAAPSQIGNAINVSGGTFVLINTVLNGPGQLTNASTLALQSSTINANVENQGQLSVTGNASTIQGAFHNATGASLSISGSGGCGGGSSGTLTVANGFTNNGSIAINTAGNACGTGDGSATLNVTSGTLLNAPGATIVSSNSNTNGANFLNAALDNQGALTVGYTLALNKPLALHSNSGTITIPSSRTLSVTGGAFRYDAGLLSGDGTLEFNGTTVQLAADLTDSLGLVRVIGGATLNGPGRLTLQRPLELKVGTINADIENKSSLSVFRTSAINGTLHNALGAALGIFSEGGCGGSAPAVVTVAQGFTNEGTLTLLEDNNACGTGSGPLTFTVTSGTLVNAPSGVIRSQTTNVNFPGTTFNVALDNQGTLQIDHDLNMAGALPSLTSSGAINISSGRTLTITGGAFNFVAGSFNNFGPLVLNNSTFNLTPDFTHLPGRSITLNGTNVTGTGVFTNQGTLNVFNSSIGAGLVNDEGGQITTTGLASSFNGSFSNANGATLAIGNGAGNADTRLTIASGFTNAGFLGLTAVSSNGSQPHAATLNVTNGTLVNTGTISSTGNPFTDLGFDNRLNAELDNQATVSVGARPLTINRPGAQHRNSGTISLSSGQLFAITSGTFTNLNTGALTGGTYLIAGTFQFPNAAIATNAAKIVLDGATARIIDQSDRNALRALASNLAGASLTLRNGATIATQAGVSNEGDLTIGVASTLTIAGEYTQTATGSFSDEIGGPATGQFGRLIASGQSHLDGAFHIHLVNGFGPSQGQSYTVQTFAGHAGNFATFSGLNLAHVRVFDVVTEAARVLINATANAGDLMADANSIVIPPSGTSGEDVQVTYTIRNTTATPVLGDWMDSLYLSADASLDDGDALIGRIEHTGGLDDLASYTTTATFALPGTVEGNYRVIVVTDSRGLAPDRERANNTAVSSSVIRTQLAALALGQTTSISLAGGDQRFFRLDVPPGSALQLGVNFSEVGPAAPSGVFLLFGQIPTPGSSTQSALSNQGLHQDLLLSGAGTHYVLIRNPNAPGNVQTIDLTPALLTFSLQRVAPDHGSQVGQATVTVRGTGFAPTDSVVLQSSAGAVRPAQRVLFKDASTLFATFDLTGLETGSYDLRVTKGAGVVTNAASFQVTSGAPGHVSYQVNSPPRIRAGSVGKVTIDYLNDGDTDVPAPTVLLKSGETPVVVPAFQIVYVTTGGGGGGGGGNSSIFVLPHVADLSKGIIKLQFLAINQDGLGGVLSPGARGHVELEFRGTNQPSPPDLFFTVYTDEHPAIVDFKKDELRPPTVSPEAWDVLFAKFLARVGTGDLEYQTALDDAASYLSLIGQSTSNVAQLTAFLVEQEDNAYPGGILAASIDAAAPATGMPLTLARVYSQPISRRYELGNFGRGWLHSYEMTIQSVPDQVIGNAALLIIHGPGGDRAFKKNAQNPAESSPPETYSGQFGDAGKIETVSGGLRVLTDPDGTQYVFDATGRLRDIEDSNGNKVSLIYIAGRLTSAVHSNGDTFAFDYNAQGRISQMTDQAGRVTTYTYDAIGEHLLQVAGPQGTVAYTYDTGHGAASEHALTSVTNVDATHVFYRYDSEGRLIHSEGDAGAGGVSLNYGPEGTVAFSDAAGATGTVLFDPMGHAAQVRDSLGHIVTRTYDSNARLDRERLPGNLTVDHDFDASGFLQRVVDPSGHQVRTQFVPTSRGIGFSTNTRLVEISDELGLRTQYRYDGRGNLASIQYPQGPSPQFSHDGSGNLTAFVNRRGQAITYTYNARGQLTRKTHADGTHEDFTYDSRGNMLTAADEHGSTAFEYDAADRLTRVTYPNGRFLAYTRDTGGRVARLEAQDGFVVDYGYDAAGRLASVRDATGADLASYTYDAAGRLIRQDHANGTFTTYDHDLAGQITRLVNFAPDNAVNSRFDYVYDDLGRRTQITTLDGIWSYEYDPAGQLTRAVFASLDIGIPSQDLQYEYDPAGNRIRTTHNGVVTPYTTNKLDQYTLVGAASYSYDADGNLIAVGSGGTGTSNAFDDEGRLIGVTTAAGNWTYEYDALGQRVASVHNGQRTEFLLDPTGLVDVVGEYNGTGSALAHYAYGLGLTSRVGVDGTPDFYDFDGAGSTAGLTGTSGSYINAYSYLPFGEAQGTPQETVANPFAYVGQFGVMQESNGLDFMRARYYSPSDGRFISADPIGVAGGINLYRYAGNNPVTQADPLGLISPYELFLQLEAEEAAAAAALEKLANQATQISVQNFGTMQVERSLGATLLSEEGPRILSRAMAKVRTFGAGALGIGLVEGFVAGWVADFLQNPNRYFDDLHAGIEVALRYYFPAMDSFFKHLVCDAFGCDEPDPAGGSKTTQVLSLDPNDIVGPAGFGDQGFLTPDFALPYTIHFENLAAATAPAQTVVVTEQLDADLDFNTFELGNISFGDFEFAVSPGLQSFSARFDVREKLGIFLDIAADFNPLTGLATWTFTSVDPTTFDLPVDPDFGFLPPNVISPAGEGFVSYTVHARAALATGARLDAQARVVFDTNDPIDTPAIFNTIDAAGPTSSVDPLPSLTLSDSFLVSWTGLDDAGGAAGAGVSTFDVSVAIDGGALTMWQANTNQHSAIYAGEFGHQYAFSSVATDHVGHRQPEPTAPTTTYVTHQPGFTSAALTTATQDALYRYEISTSDADTSEWRTITAAQLPAWLTLVDHGDGTATLTGTPGNSFVGLHSVVLRVADSVGAAQTQSFVIRVANINDPPTSIHLSRASVFADLPGAWIAQVTVADTDVHDAPSFTLNDQRFTINAGQLFLKTGQFLNRNAEPVVTLRITATDSGVPAQSITATFVLIVDARPPNWDHAYQWKLNPFDVNLDGVVSPLDALLIINELNFSGPRSLPLQPGGTAHPNFFDVSGDDSLNPLDALLVIIYLNSGGSGEGELSVGNDAVAFPQSSDRYAESVDDAWTLLAPSDDSDPDWWQVARELDAAQSERRKAATKIRQVPSPPQLK